MEDKKITVEELQLAVEQEVTQMVEVLNRWRTLDLPIMPPVPVSFHTFPHKQPGLHNPMFYACVYDYRTSRCN